MPTLEEAAGAYLKARQWTEECRRNSGRLKAELKAAEDRLDKANTEVYETHEALLEAALAVKTQ